MSDKPVPGVAFNLNPKNVVITTAIVTATTLVTVDLYKGLNRGLAPLTRRLNRKIEEVEDKNS